MYLFSFYYILNSFILKFKPDKYGETKPKHKKKSYIYFLKFLLNFDCNLFDLLNILLTNI